MKKECLSEVKHWLHFYSETWVGMSDCRFRKVTEIVGHFPPNSDIKEDVGDSKAFQPSNKQFSWSILALAQAKLNPSLIYILVETDMLCIFHKELDIKTTLQSNLVTQLKKSKFILVSTLKTTAPFHCTFILRKFTHHPLLASAPEAFSVSPLSCHRRQGGPSLPIRLSGDEASCSSAHQTRGNEIPSL